MVTDRRREVERDLQILDTLATTIEDDTQSIVNSQLSSDDDEKDWVKGLAQRATRPFIKQELKRGPFMVRAGPRPPLLSPPAAFLCGVGK